MSEAEIINSERASTGIEGLDYILKGGLSRKRLYLVQGNPGTVPLTAFTSADLSQIRGNKF